MTYRDEIKAHQARERDFRTLQELMADLQRRIRGAEQDIREAQTAHEDVLTTHAKTISHLQGDIESLKKNVHDRQQEGIKVYDEIQIVKRNVEDRIAEIFNNQRELEGMRQYND